MFTYIVSCIRVVCAPVVSGYSTYKLVLCFLYRLSSQVMTSDLGATAF